MDSRPYLWGPHLIEGAVIEKTRSLPLGGEVLVEKGSLVEAGTIVAHLNPEGYLHFVNVGRDLDVPYNLAAGCLVKSEGDAVNRGEVIAARPAALGLLLAECRSPTDGIIEKVYPSGHLTIRSYPIPVEAFIPGRVVETNPGDSVSILTSGTIVQGVWGQGGERHGRLVILEPGKLNAPAGAIVVSPDPAGPGLVRACRRAGVGAVVAPSAHLADLERAGDLTIVLTEGFGLLPMSGPIFSALSALSGREASVSGFTQLRAGVDRPEIIIRDKHGPARRPAGRSVIRLGRRTRVYVDQGIEIPVLAVGSKVRFTRRPNLGREGVVVNLPAQPERIATGALLPVARVRLDDGRAVVTPRCNLEILQLDPGEGES